jgi:dihydrofolate synthase/folylpolyglutamate synthase
VAAALLDVLPEAWRPGSAAVVAGFARARLAGRFDRRGRWIFDVAHNPAGIQVLVGALREAQPARSVHALVGILTDKAWREMLASLKEVVDRMWLTTPPTAPPERRWVLTDVRRGMEEDGRGWKAMEGGGEEHRPPSPSVPSHPPFIIEPDFDRALREVQSGAGTILVTGSFHTVGDALARLPGFAPLG